MAADLFDADAGALDSASTEFSTCANNTQDVMTRLRNQSSNLQSSFQGSAAQAFYAKVDELCQQLQTLYDHINTTSTDLKGLAAQVRQLQADASSKFSNA